LGASPPPATLSIRPGEYWLLVCDSQTGEIVQSGGRVAIWLSGPDDPLVLAVRRHGRWLKRVDREQLWLKPGRLP